MNQISTTSRTLLLFLLLFALATNARAADAIIHNKDGYYQCEESWARVTVVVNYSDLFAGYDTVIVNSDNNAIFTFQPTAPSGTVTAHLVDAHASAAVAGTYGIPYTMYYYRAAYAVQINISRTVSASGGREIIGLAVDDNGLPGTNCPYNDVENDVTLVYTVSGATPTPTPTPSPTPGANTKCDDLKLGGNQESCSACNGVNAVAANVGMARYSIHAMLVSLNITDTPLKYSPAYGPSVGFTLSYNQRDSQQPATFNYSNLGPKWTFNWLSYVSDDPHAQLPLTALYRSGGGAEFFAYDQQSGSFVTDPQSHATLVKTSSTSYERRLPDGSKEVFATSDGALSYPRRIFLTEIYDSANNKVSLEYDTNRRIKKIKDAQLKETILSYELPTDGYKITKVTDPFGRFATFEYDSSGRLQTITDEIGIQSTFGYLDQSDFVNSITTPYGPTTFTKGESATNRWIEATDPEGGKERVEYQDDASGIGATEPVPDVAGLTNVDLHLRNTFYWDKKAMLEAPGVLTQAQITHWLLNADGSVSGIPASKKQPLENRIWYTYLGQSDTEHAGPNANPSQIARVLADTTTTQLFQYEYNGLGKTTKSIDPVGRVMTYVYPNQIDLTEVRQTTGGNNDLLREFTYDPLHQPPHLPVTEKDAAGQPTTYTYNPQGQILTRMNAKNEVTTYVYGDGGAGHPVGFLRSVTSPTFNGNSATTLFEYDSFNRVHTVTDSDGYIVTTDYDNLDRKTKVTYLDGTYEEFRYTDNDSGVMTLDLTGSSDRRGLWTYRKYDGNQHMVSIKDPQDRITLYGWCTCGSLTSITDPNTNVTTFNRDIQSRVYEKVYQADGSKITYLYEGQTVPNTTGATSRLKSSTDAKNQQTNYLYYADDNLQQVSYANAVLPTPTVNYVYDPNYNRVTSMTDGIGTTYYTYYPVAAGTLGAGKLYTTSGPLPHSTITLGYDELGRVVSQDVNGTPASMTYDSLGRAGASSNALGSFGRTYDGVTARLLTLNYPNGQTASYTYFDNLNDRRLKTIQNVFGTPPNLTANLSRHDYTYDASGQIQTWNKLLGDSETDLSFGYDNADQLTSVSQGRTQFAYEYDAAGNRLIDRFYTPGRFGHHGGNFYTANTLNELDTVTRDPGVGPGSGPFPITYDADGNMTDDGGNRTFEWDAANRLVAINYSAGNRTEFVYDGLSRRTKIIESDGDTKTFVWSGNTIAEERGATGLQVTKRFFAEGVQRIGGSDAGNYYYSRDHLGSVREVTDASGVLKTQYDYDAWGNQVVVTGNMSFDFGYTGLYRHAASNLNLAVYRAYDPTMARWLNRDPIGERGGLNLYGYTSNNSLRWTDRSGLLVPVPPVLAPPSVVFTLPAVSPWLWPVGAGLLGYAIGDTPIVRDFFDRFFTRHFFNEDPSPSGVNNPDPERNPEYRELVRIHEKECSEMIIEMEKAMGCELSRRDYEDRFRECMRGKGHGWY